jgi:hypothetical protein
MNNLLKTIFCLFIFFAFSNEAICQNNIVFSDIKDSELYSIRYFVFAEAKLGDFRDDIRGNNFKNSNFLEFIRNNNRKTINVILVRTLSKKETNIIEKIVFYSTREQDTKLVEEVTLTRPNDSKDIDLLVSKTVIN